MVISILYWKHVLLPYELPFVLFFALGKHPTEELVEKAWLVLGWEYVFGCFIDLLFGYGASFLDIKTIQVNMLFGIIIFVNLVENTPGYIPLNAYLHLLKVPIWDLILLIAAVLAVSVHLLCMSQSLVTLHVVLHHYLLVNFLLLHEGIALCVGKGSPLREPYRYAGIRRVLGDSVRRPETWGFVPRTPKLDTIVASYMLSGIVHIVGFPCWSLLWLECPAANVQFCPIALIHLATGHHPLWLFNLVTLLFWRSLTSSVWRWQSRRLDWGTRE